MSKIFYRLGLMAIVMLLVLGLGACSNVNKKASDDIITQTVLSKDKIPVTVLVKNAFSINAFEKAVEEKFPQLDIIQVGNYACDMGIAEYETRLKHDDLTDIVMTWPLEVGEQYWDDELMDLSSLPLTGKYMTGMLNNIAKDGKLYYLPGPSQVRGILYNKTLFEENGWEVPQDFNGFIDLCQTIEASGMRSLQLGLKNEEVLDTAFIGYGYESSLSTPKNTQWITDYNNGKGSFGDNFTLALDTFQTLIDKGVLKKEDLKIDYADRERMIFTRKCAMVEDSSLMTHLGFGRTGSTDEFALMPFFNPGESADWARLYPVCYIGLNKKLENSENKEKYDLVMELFEYISTPEGQLALAGDTGAMFSSLNGVPSPDVPEIKDLRATLAHGRYAIFPTFKNVQSALREGLAGMVEGKLNQKDVIKMVDDQNFSRPVTKVIPVIGKATEDFSLIETGHFITDTMQKESGCEIALFMDNGKDGKTNGKGINGRLYKGDLTAGDIKRILPDIRDQEKMELWKVTMTGEDLIKTLEHSIPVDNNNTGWFYYFSGLQMDYAPSAEPGKRIHKITDSAGKKIDAKQIYTIAVMDKTVPEKFLKSCDKTGILISDILEKEIQSKKKITPSKDGRFTVSEP
ncbi:MAG: extracellular solute-binding protein [Eubacterium sp.]